MIVYDPNLKIFYSDLINDQIFFSGFATKALGDGRKLANVFKFFKEINLDLKTLVYCRQIHSTNIQIVSLEKDYYLNTLRIEDNDGLLTKQSKIVLLVLTADCSPIIYVDKKTKIIGISHQGWRGSIKKMTQKMIDKMLVMGAKVKNIKVAIGPTIGQCCYSISEDRYYQFREEFDGYSDKIFRYTNNQWHLNLILLNYLLLIEKGVEKKNIDFFPFCTKCDKKRFFSFRRDKSDDYGEMFSFIIRKK